MHFGGSRRVRTADILLVREALYQLSYGPKIFVVGVFITALSQSMKLNPCNSKWWVQMDSNHRPTPYQDGALPLSYVPNSPPSRHTLMGTSTFTTCHSGFFEEDLCTEILRHCCNTYFFVAPLSSDYWNHTVEQAV